MCSLTEKWDILIYPQKLKDLILYYNFSVLHLAAESSPCRRPFLVQPSYMFIFVGELHYSV